MQHERSATTTKLKPKKKPLTLGNSIGFIKIGEKGTIYAMQPVDFWVNITLMKKVNHEGHGIVRYERALVASKKP